MSHFMMYLFVMLDSFKSVLGVIAGWNVAIFALSTIILGLIYIVNKFERNGEEVLARLSKVYKIYKFICVSFLITTLLYTAIPTTKQVAVIYLIPKIVNNEQVQSIGKNSLGILEKYTEQYLNDLANKFEEETVKSEKGKNEKRM